MKHDQLDLKATKGKIPSFQHRFDTEMGTEGFF